MTQDNPAERLNRLEILFSEQEYTIETLNTLVTRQSGEIARLDRQVDALLTQLRDLREQLPDTVAGDEKPPHY